MLESGDFATINELAAAEKVNPAAVAPVLDSGTISGEQLPRLGAA
jgi:hypothetical protein